MKKFTIFTIVALLAVALIVPQVMAASKVTPYGRMWFDTFSVKWDKNSGNTIGAANGTYNANFEEQDLVWTDIGYSMVGFNFKTDYITAKVEINNTVGQRHWYGTYNFGAGTLLVGHTWDLGYLSCIPLTNADAGLIPWHHKGGIPATMAREAQIRLTFPTEYGVFNFAATTPQTTAIDTNAVASVAATVTNIAGVATAVAAVPNTPINANGTTAPLDYETELPAFRVQWITKPIGPLFFILFAGYNSYEVVYNPTATSEMRFDVDSTVFSAQAIATFGPFTTKLILGRSENAENYAVGNSAIYNYGAFLYRNPTNGAFTLHDNTLSTWLAEFTYRATKDIKIIFSYGEDSESGDFPGTTREWETSSWGIMVPITITPGFQIIPQYNAVDLGTLNTNGVDAVPDAGDASMIGIQWKFTF